MNLTDFTDAKDYLERVQGWLEKRESANSLILGLAERLRADPNFYPSQPLMRCVEDKQGLALAALMTPPHKLILASERENTLAAVEALAQDLAKEEWDLPGVLGPTKLAREFATIWSDLRGVNFHPRVLERLFELTEVVPPLQPPGQLRLAEEADLELAAVWIYEFNIEAIGTSDLLEAQENAKRRIMEGSLFMWDDNSPVSIAAWTRPVGRGVSVGLVYTPPNFRRRGYASACVAALSQRLLDSGYQYCALFTDLANPTSNHIYQQIGYRPVCDFDEIEFM